MKNYDRIEVLTEISMLSSMYDNWMQFVPLGFVPPERPDPEKTCEEDWNNYEYQVNRMFEKWLYSEYEELLELREGQLVAYVPKDIYGNIYKCQIGRIKRYAGEGAWFVYYHCGDTAARTTECDLVKIENDGYLKTSLGRGDDYE